MPRFYDVRTIGAMAVNWKDDNPTKSVGGHWVPERSTVPSTVPRLILAWWVLTGQADVLLWPSPPAKPKHMQDDGL